MLTGLSTVQAAPAEISSARIIQPPPGAKVAAAYFTISNNSDKPLVITGASSDAIPNVSIHLSAVVDDVAKMIPQDSVTIEAGNSLEFKHGSYHLMLMGLTAPLSPGTMLAFEIDTSAGVLPIMIPIITPDQASANESHAMKHDSMDHDSKEHDSMGSDSKEDDSMDHDSKEHDSMDHDSKEHDSIDHNSKEHDRMDHDSTEHDADSDEHGSMEETTSSTSSDQDDSHNNEEHDDMKASESMDKN